jgi:tetratricopeptide (TPR) repeat protein
MYGLHPALPFDVMAEWRRMAGVGFASEHAAAERALLTAYGAFGSWLLEQIQGAAADTAYALIERQRRTMGRMLGFALSEKRYGEAQELIQPLNEFWNARGQGLEAQRWSDRCQKALEAADGTPLDLDSAAGSLWLFVVGAEATRAIRAGQLDAAYATYDLFRQRLEVSGAESRERRLAVAYHQLGAVAQHRGDLTAAETWYRKSLEIKEALGNRPGMATTYHQLGRVAQLRGDLTAAETWYRKSLEIEEVLGNQSGMATSYHQLGTTAQHRGDLTAANDWYRKSVDIEEALGDRPGMATSYHQLGIMAQHRGDLPAAEDWYRKSLEIEGALGNRTGMTSTYHNLGVVAQCRGDLTAAENWYRKSLDIDEALGNRPGMALTYCALGLLAEEREDIAAAIDWTVRCIALFAEFPHPATGPGPQHLVRLTAALDLPALEASWQRCTGTSLPPNIRSAVTAAIDKGRSAQMSSLDLLATCALSASMTTLYSAAGGLKAYRPCMSVRSLPNIRLLSSSINRTGIFRAISPSVKRTLHTTLSALSFLHWTRKLCASPRLDRDNAIRIVAKLTIDFISMSCAVRNSGTNVYIGDRVFY